MKRYIKSADSSIPNKDVGDLYGILLQDVMSWEHKYLSVQGINDPEGSISNYQKNSGDKSYITEVLSMLKTFLKKKRILWIRLSSLMMGIRDNENFNSEYI